jgi:hypothetical protein
MAELPSEDIYAGVNAEERIVAGRSWLIAEARSLRSAGVTRDHTRVIGRATLEVAGHPIVYSDFYSSPREKMYVYARHRVGQAAFFAHLDAFLEEKLPEFPELQNEFISLTLQVSGSFRKSFVALPLAQGLDHPVEDIDFVRLALPPGDIAIEFTAEAAISSHELDFIAQRALPRQLEAPLVSYDATRSDFWAEMVARIHWATDVLETEVLRTLIRSVTPAVA